MRNACFLCLMAFPLFFACNQSDLDTTVGKSCEVSFSVTDIRERGVVSHTKESITSMTVFGYSTGLENFDIAKNPIPDFMYDQSVSRTSFDDPWTYSPIQYWSLDPSKKHSFFAFSPQRSEMQPETDVMISTPETEGYPSVTFSIPDDVSKQCDLLYADALNQTRLSNTSHTGFVPFTFKHALSWLSFTIAPKRKVGASERFRVKGMSLWGYGITRAILNLGTGVWSNPEFRDLNYAFDVNEEIMEVGRIYPATAENSNLMVIPQAFSYKSGGILLNITYEYSTDAGQTWDPDLYSVSIPLPDTNMESGMHYIFIVKLSVDEVKVEMASPNTIESWVEGGNLLFEDAHYQYTDNGWILVAE